MPASPRLTRDAQRVQTRRELLDAAANVFAAKGFHAASVDDVAVAAGYTKGAVYSNFDSKEELFLALFAQSTADTIVAIDEVLASPPEGRFDALGQARDRMAFFSPQWHMLEMEFTLYVARNPHLQQKLVERQRALREQVAARVQRHLDDTGATTHHDTMVLARLIGAAGDGLTMQQLAEGDQAPDMGPLFSTLLEIVFRGATT